MTDPILAYPHLILTKGGIQRKPREPLACQIMVRGRPCGKDPVRFYKHLQKAAYIGFCEEHANQYPEGWSAFKPVDAEEVITYEVMET
jgi:hypothetical protein